jgi:TonB-dependent starch-binding outer membrane protein SusC
MRNLLSLLMAMLLLSGQLLAQNRTITGKVTDANGAPLPNASVLLKGTNTGTTTKVDGTFSLTVPASARTLVVSAVGLAEQEVSIANRTTVDVIMKADDKSLSEVVVVGYQVRRKRDEAGAISSVRAAQIENLPNVSLDRALQGKAAGVLVQANNGIPGGAINVRIRGAGSIQAGNDPLYIVDGVQLNIRNDASFTQSNPLSFLNPDDIESIDILKDASAAIYGSNAANGVVIITTKKGKSGKTKFTANVYFGQARPLQKLDVMNAQEFYQVRAEGYGSANNLLPSNLAIKRAVLGELRVPGAAALTDKQADSAIAALQTYDWQDAAFRTGSIKNYELSASGGNDRTTFRVSASYTDQETIVTKADFKRYAMKADITNKATERLTLGTSISLSTFTQNLPFSTDGSFLGSPAFSASGIIPTNPIYNADGTYYGVPGATPANLAGTLNQNIIAVNDWNSGYNRTNQLIGNINADYRITKWLTARAFAGLDYRLVQGRQVRDARTPDAFVRKGLTQSQSTNNTNLNLYGTLNFNHSFGNDHTIDGVVGYEYRKEDQESLSAAGDGFPTYQFTYLNNAANPLAVGEFYSGFRRNGIFGAVNFSYNRRYVIGLVGRYDGSSRFAEDYRFGKFGGVKVAWNLDREAFLESSKIVSQLRLRASYGTTGNDQIGNFDALGLYGGAGVYNGSGAIAFNQLANEKLKWESTTLLNFGLDFAFFDNRINGSIEWYNKNTSDLLLTQPLQSSTGFTGITTNIGKNQNRGVELTIGADIIKGRRQEDLTWNVNFVMGYNKAKVTELYGGLKILPSNNSIQVGQPVGVLFTQKFAGVNAATGRPMWYDTLGNITYQVQARDRVLLGPTALPEYQGGLRNTFSWKGFTLDVFFQYEYGRYANDGQVNFLFENIARINAVQYVYDNRWTAPGQVTSIPRFNINGTESKSSGAQSGNRMWFKADYVRLKNLTVSYDLTPNITKTLRLNSARFYVQATNLYTFSDWFSYDIEFVGTATGIIPQSKNFTVGLQVGF